MENLKEKLKKDAEIIKVQIGTGLPVEVLIMHALKQAETNAEYKEKLEKENFAATILYMCEWFIKEIVESEMTGKSAYVSDEISFKALNEWILASEEDRKELIVVLTEVKHPRSERSNPFLKSDFLSKKNLDNIEEDFKKLPIMEMLIKKYYVEPKPATTTKKSTTPSKKPAQKAKKTQSEQMSLDMFEQLMGNNETKQESKEEESNDTDKVEENKVQDDSTQEQVHKENVSLPDAASETVIQETSEENSVKTVEQTEEAVENEDVKEEEQVIPVSEPEVEVSEETPEAPKQIDLFSLF